VNWATDLASASEQWCCLSTSICGILRLWSDAMQSPGTAAPVHFGRQEPAAQNVISRIEPASGQLEMSWTVGYTLGMHRKLVVSANNQILVVTKRSIAEYSTNGQLVRDVDRSRNHLSYSDYNDRHLYDVMPMPDSKYDRPGHSLPHSDHIVLNWLLSCET